MRRNQNSIEAHQLSFTQPGCKEGSLPYSARKLHAPTDQTQWEVPFRRCEASLRVTGLPPRFIRRHDQLGCALCMVLRTLHKTPHTALGILQLGAAHLSLLFNSDLRQQQPQRAARGFQLHEAVYKADQRAMVKTRWVCPIGCACIHVHRLKSHALYAQPIVSGISSNWSTACMSKHSSACKPSLPQHALGRSFKAATMV